MISFNDNSQIGIEDILGQGGLIAQNFSGFEVRPQQVEMAKAVKEAFDGGRHLAVEAGTGVGKSFAYLAAAIDRAQQNKGRLLISTYTINLQQQLINKDIPFLAGICPHSFDAQLAKGKGNYLCKRRLEYALRKQQGMFDQLLSELHDINNWSKRTEDGSLSDLPSAPSHELWDAVQCEHGNCRGKKCRHFRECFYFKARRRLETADIIVANHALMFSDLILKEQSIGVLPEYTHVVIDEAHNIEHVAEDHFGLNISNFTITYLLRSLFNKKTRKGLLAAKGCDDAVELVDKCAKAAKVFFTQVQAWFKHADPQECGKCQPGFVDDNISEPIRELRLSLSALAKASDDEDEKSEFGRYVDRCKGLEMDIKDFLTQPRETNVYWVEAPKGRSRRVALRSAPLDVGPYVKRCLFDVFESVITTSATLSCDDNDKHGFDFFASRIGLEDFEALKLGSPFDYEKNVTLYLEPELPEPNMAEFHDKAVEKIKEYLLQSQGRAFVLFTSYSMLKKMADEMEDWMAANDMELLVQGAGIDRAALLEDFKMGQKSVLFGTDSFWQGVDVPGDALSNVIIMRLPFAVPNHPLLKGRIEQIKQNGGNAFMDYQLPMAIIKFKQGFGRLVRTKTDKGIVVILDSRIARKFYGKKFVNAIPKCRLEIVREDCL